MRNQPGNDGRLRSQSPTYRSRTPLKMEATPYIDRGRTIVPLSFIRDSMDVKVTFDPATGHLLIESNK